MFRRLTNRISSALGTAENENLQALIAMGFEASAANAALAATDNNVERAAELLLVSSTQQQTTSSSRPEPPAPRRTAAMNRAAAAAAARQIPSTPQPSTPSSRLVAHHPDVKVIPKLQEKSKEEQILRCADRLKQNHVAVDTLLRALSTVRDHPENPKFRKVDKTTAGYQRSLANVPGAEDFLRAMNYRDATSTSLILDRAAVDPALLYLGISALEQMRLTKEYQESKMKAVFAKEIEQIRAEADYSEAEAIARANFLSKCPSEPGKGGLVQITMANETIRRRFDGDDTLEDVLNFLGAHGTKIPENLVNKEWALVDSNRYPLLPIDCHSNRSNTLQYIGCWPSGKLEILPNKEEWLSNENLVRGDSRGLGSAPADLL